MTENTFVPLPIYTPDNEPYIGRQSVYHFDQVIQACLEDNRKVAAYTHRNQLTDLQKAACQIIPQGLNLALTIRELIRQGYLFGAVVLMRPLIERAAIISYLMKHPEAIKTWENGWNHRGQDARPSFNKMLESMSGGNAEMINASKQVAETFHHIVHGDPIGSQFNLVRLSDGALGYSVGKVISEPELCDFICFQSYGYLLVVHGMMIACFPGALDKLDTNT